jgi:aldose 1-epimerase
MFPRGLSRSPWLPVIVITILILGPGFGWYLHRHGRFSTLKRQIRTEMNAGAPSDLDAGRPGGQDPIILTRKMSGAGDQPEFLSATLLPGMGMTLLQITANIPGQGEKPLLSAPSAQAVSSGAMEPPNGEMDDHGAIEVPWGGNMMGVTTPVGSSVIGNWHGHSIEESTDGSAQPAIAEGGTLVSEASDGHKTTASADGAEATAVYRGMNTDDRWPSKTDVSVSVQMEARTIDLMVTAKNSGNQAEPIGIGWHPRFDVGDARNHIWLALPNGKVMEIADASREMPSGQFSAASGEVARLQGHGDELGAGALDTTLVDLTPETPKGGTSVELRDAEAGYGIRMTAVSANVRLVRVVAPAENDYVSVGMQTNMEDPFGKEWNDLPQDGIATLKPGESLEWHVRLEIFPVAHP